MFGRAITISYPAIEEVYDRYAALQMLSPGLSGSLLLHTYLDAEGVALTVAANVAGLASLCIEPEPQLAKQAMRTGVCEFVVNDADEALQILKQELRKAHPVAVTLLGEPEFVLAELIERGLQPEIMHLAADGQEMAEARTFLARGACRLPEPVSTDGWVAVHWSVAREPQRWLPLADILASGAVDAEDPSGAWRRRWIECSPRFLGRHYAAQRFARMRPAEADAFFAAIQRDVEAGEIQVAVSVVRDGQEELVLS
ncbi:hypothetical protein GCM10011586_06460 [Silvibacterium dinghuense]|nr:hypothetical protein GCM10011586_06460 [Silvibacterium dinghuense]